MGLWVPSGLMAGGTTTAMQNLSIGNYPSNMRSFISCNRNVSSPTTTIKHPMQARTFRFSSATFRAKIRRDFLGKALGNYPWNRAKPSTTIGAIPSPTTIIKRPKRLSKCWYVQPEKMPICCSTSDLNPMATCPLWHSTAFMPSENGSNNMAQPSITRAEDSWHPMIGA